MTGNLPAQFGMIVLVLLLPYGAPAKETEFAAKDGTRVVVLPVSKPSNHNDSENKLEFYSPKNQMLCALDYSSKDGEHGFGVVKAAWTPDNKYFVFSLTSSGGHQPWHAPTLFYSIRDNSIDNVDNYADAAISKADFTLKDSNTVLTEVWRGESVPIKFHLDSLTGGRRKPQHILHCVDGKTMKAEP